MNEIQKSELKIARTFMNVCEKYNIEYLMLGGTMLGAIRHQGFIPWDDDMDFGLLREDYEFLLNKLLNGNIKELNILHYSLNNCTDYPFKLVDKSVRLIDHNKEEEQETFAWIDIFPLDGMPNGCVVRQLHMYNLLEKRALVKLSELDFGVAKSNPNRSAVEKIVIFLGKLTRANKHLDFQTRMNKLDLALKKYPPRKSKKIVNFMGAYKFKEMFESRVYLETSKFKFEDIHLSGTRHFDEYLGKLYGEYMKLPPLEKRDKHKVEVK